MKELFICIHAAVRLIQIFVSLPLAKIKKKKIFSIPASVDWSHGGCEGLKATQLVTFHLCPFLGHNLSKVCSSCQGFVLPAWPMGLKNEICKLSVHPCKLSYVFSKVVIVMHFSSLNLVGRVQFVMNVWLYDYIFVMQVICESFMVKNFSAIRLISLYLAASILVQNEANRGYIIRSFHGTVKNRQTL